MATLDRAVWEQLDPRKMPPNGDRYLVEKMDIGELTKIIGQDGKAYDFFIPVVDTYDERGNKKAGEDPEGKAGFFMARVIARGNGHRLEADVTVPMFHDVDDVVLCERYTGRELKLAKGTYRVVSQVDVLCRVEELSPVREFASGDTATLRAVSPDDDRWAIR